MPKSKTPSIPRAKNLDRLHEVIQDLVGQECWKVACSYGGELVLHLGPRIACEHPQMKEELEGEWMLGTCGTSWKLSTPSGDIDSTEDEEADVEEAKILEGAKVAAFEAAVDSLLVSFDNQCSLHVVPTAREAQERDVPLWELFMPGNMFVEFHPGGIWSYKRSDLPAS